MKILLICAGGMSTSILMKKIQKYSDDNNLGLEEIAARGMGDFDDVYQQYDAILLGPQISYKRADIEKATGKPLDVVAAYDYAIGNAENIFKQINKLVGK